MFGFGIWCQLHVTVGTCMSGMSLVSSAAQSSCLVVAVDSVIIYVTSNTGARVWDIDSRHGLNLPSLYYPPYLKLGWTRRVDFSDDRFCALVYFGMGYF